MIEQSNAPPQKTSLTSPKLDVVADTMQVLAYVFADATLALTVEAGFWVMLIKLDLV
jgi:hypothetical protein